jgi:ferrous iron transport protein B
VFKRSVLRGETRPLLLELPSYKVPSLRNAALAAADRGVVFLRKAGSVILLLSIGMWVLSAYPRLPAGRLAQLAPPETLAELGALGQAAAAGDADAASRAEALVGPFRLEHSLAGRLGKLVEPVFLPLGFDWRIGLGVLSSFAARETLVSTLSVVFAAGDADASSAGLRGALRAQRRPDGTPLFDTATACSLLVFFALAMQCLATLAVTRRETGSWRIAAFQLGYMTVLAYAAAFITYQSLRLLTG